MDESQVVNAINKARKGIAEYLEIMELVQNVDADRDRNFQRKYNAFYRMRQRPKEWYEVYFSYLENSKSKVPAFDDVLGYLFSTFGRCEPSFSSKLVATLNPDEPVWDRFVLENTGQTAPSYRTKNRIEKAKTVYQGIQSWYHEYLPSQEGRDVIRIFNQEVQEQDRITDLKKIDFVLWQTRG